MPRSETVSQRRGPTLLSSCARAATAEEARFRLHYPRASLTSRIVALDEGAGPIVCRLAEAEWSGEPRFLIYQGLDDPKADGGSVDPQLKTCDGAQSRLMAEVEDADVVVMIATSDDAAEAAGLIGDACATRGIMTTGLVVADWGTLDATVANLRPNAMVMLISRDQQDLRDVLTALRV